MEAPTSSSFLLGDLQAPSSSNWREPTFRRGGVTPRSEGTPTSMGQRSLESTKVLIWGYPLSPIHMEPDVRGSLQRKTNWLPGAGNVEGDVLNSEASNQSGANPFVSLVITNKAHWCVARESSLRVEAGSPFWRVQGLSRVPPRAATKGHLLPFFCFFWVFQPAKRASHAL